MKFIQNPHAPLHIEKPDEIYFISAGTYLKKNLFDQPKKLSILKEENLKLSQDNHFQFYGYSLLHNHYHLLLQPTDQFPIHQFIRKIHAKSALALNRIDKTLGRRVWYQYWDRCVRNEKEFVANLNYIYWNPVKHRYINEPNKWPFTWINEQISIQESNTDLQSWDDF
jgi:putative transposase